MAGQLSQTQLDQIAGGVCVAASLCEARREERLLRTAQRRVPDDPVEWATVGVREVFQQEGVPFGQRSGALLTGSAETAYSPRRRAAVGQLVQRPHVLLGEAFPRVRNAQHARKDHGQ